MPVLPWISVWSRQSLAPRRQPRRNPAPKVCRYQALGKPSRAAASWVWRDGFWQQDISAAAGGHGAGAGGGGEGGGGEGGGDGGGGLGGGGDGGGGDGGEYTPYHVEGLNTGGGARSAA